MTIRHDREAPMRLRTTHLLRRTSAIAVATVAAGLVLPAAAPTAFAATSVNGVRLNAYEARLVTDINNVRRSHGLVALVVTPGTTDVARGWSWRLASAAALSHNPNLVSQVGHSGSADWTAIAENVGYSSATDPDTLFNAYMNSPPHRANILDASMRYLGIGVVERPQDGTLYAWNTMDFVDRYSSTYGLTRQPAAGMHLDARVVSSTTDVATFESGPDQRFRTACAGTIRCSTTRVDRPTTRDDALRYTLSYSGRASGYGDLVMRDGLDLSNARSISLKVAVIDPARRGLALTLWAQTPWAANSTVSLGAVTAPTSAGWLTVPVPPAARNFRSTLIVRMPASWVVRAGGNATVVVHDIRVNV